MTECGCIGPLTRIWVLGFFPCLLSEEDKIANTAYKNISSLLSKEIIYHKSSTQISQSSEGSKMSIFESFTSGLLGSTTITSSTEKWEKIKSNIRIVQGFRNNITIQITPCDKSASLEEGSEDYDDDDSETRALARQSCNHQKVVIPFHKISVINTGSSQLFSGIGSASSSLIHIYGKQSQHNPSGKGNELARFNVSQGVNRDDLVDLFMNLIHWDRNRRKSLDDDIDDESEQENSESPKKKGKGILRTKAEKAAYFAKRELEMQQVKREREKRKAKYLKESGGLKYTAMAMANME